MAGYQQRDNRQRPNRRDMPVEEKQFDERVVNIDRVARVVKGGRRFRFRALVVVGDKKGKVGIGIAKGADVTTAISKAVEVAKKNLEVVTLYKGTIPHEAEAKVGGARILVKPAAPGTGLIAGGVVRTVLEVAGISNALSKSLGSTNKINTAYATMAALTSVEPAKNWLTRQISDKKAKVDKIEEKVIKVAKATVAPKVKKAAPSKETK